MSITPTTIPPTRNLFGLHTHTQADTHAHTHRKKIYDPCNMWNFFSHRRDTGAFDNRVPQQTAAATRRFPSTVTFEIIYVKGSNIKYFERLLFLNENKLLISKYSLLGRKTTTSNRR